jgi:Ni,Fe-hydrogenase III small subunit
MLLSLKIWRTGIATEPIDGPPSEAVTVGRELDRRIKSLFGRALAIREVDAGSCNGCEVEIAGLGNPVYDMERFGVHFVASPRHADMLLVTGPVTRNMEIPLRKTYEATPDPKFVVAVGDCAATCGVFRGSYAVVGPVDRIIPVNVHITGCPPEPVDILRGILRALDQLAERRDGGGAAPSSGRMPGGIRG